MRDQMRDPSKDETKGGVVRQTVRSYDSLSFAHEWTVGSNETRSNNKIFNEKYISDTVEREDLVTISSKYTGQQRTCRSMDQRESTSNVASLTWTSRKLGFLQSLWSLSDSRAAVQRTFTTRRKDTETECRDKRHCVTKL